MGEVTVMLQGGPEERGRTAAELLPLVYDELRRMAAVRMAREQPGQTLQATALVHEAWLRMGRDGGSDCRSRSHFFAAAGEAMRRILVERARRRLAAKRGSGVVPVELEALQLPFPDPEDDHVLALEEALERLGAHDPRKAELVQLRYFVGLSFEEAAEVLGIAVPTAKGWWAYSRAWLKVEMGRDGIRKDVAS
ncbi:MAG: RNA polymerase subunit sigma [Verrucomicrobiales bacterium]|nr:RNA polymerase subunit sigma [Verrucomicrobiales bacterium]